MLQEAPGWYGKLSGHGDFASRRLPAAWIQVIDAWLCASLSASRAQLGDRWQALYLNAPVWRFALSPGVIDGHWWFGILMPSCDNVGRYFPLLVAQARLQPPADPGAFAHLEAWWTAAAEAALATLDEGSGVDSFERALHAAPAWPAPDLHGCSAVPASPSALVAPWQLPAGASCWWPSRPIDQASTTAGAGAQAIGACNVMPGLPPADAFARLLAGVRPF